MKVLLIDAQDDLCLPRATGKWDLIVDFGKASEAAYQAWSARLGCPIRTLYQFAKGVEDLESIRQLLQFGYGYLLDNCGLDWWDLLSLVFQPQIYQFLLIGRLAENLGGCTQITATRPSYLADALQKAVGCELEVFGASPISRINRRLRHYLNVPATLDPHQLQQVVLDKFDPTYALRRKFTRQRHNQSVPAILLPTAYINVSRAAIAYARLLPEERFLLVVARESSSMPELPANVSAAPLAHYAVPNRPQLRAELQNLLEEWKALYQRRLSQKQEFRLAEETGVLRRMPSLLHWGLAVREAWKGVLETENVVACLSGDDSNVYTRVPLLLANQKNIATVAFHHGALDSAMAFKQHHADTYLAKGEMEGDYLTRVCHLSPSRIVVGCANAGPQGNDALHQASSRPWVVFFSDPYEGQSWRAEEVYRDVLPRLCELARTQGRSVILKLHPFESARQRKKMLRTLLSQEDLPMVTVVDSPLSPEMLRRTWVAVTVESTVAQECACAGVPVFLLAWLQHPCAGYVGQFQRFGIGRALTSADEIPRIPALIGEAHPDPEVRKRLLTPLEVSDLQRLLVKPGINDDEIPGEITRRRAASS